MKIQTRDGLIFLAVESYPVVSISPAYEESVPESKVTLDMGGGKTLTQIIPMGCGELVELLEPYLLVKPES